MVLLSLAQTIHFLGYCTHLNRSYRLGDSLAWSARLLRSLPTTTRTSKHLQTYWNIPKLRTRGGKRVREISESKWRRRRGELPQSKWVIPSITIPHQHTFSGMDFHKLQCAFRISALRDDDQRRLARASHIVQSEVLSSEGPQKSAGEPGPALLRALATNSWRTD